jgi:hypothetical protein
MKKKQEKCLVLHTHKNLIFEEVRKTALNTPEFEWQEDYSYCTGGNFIVSKLVHKPTGYYFLFDYSSNHKHWAVFSPGVNQSMQSEYPGDWSGQWGYVLKWLAQLKLELESPDLWGTIAQEKTLTDVVAHSNDSNEKFKPKEIQMISQQVEEIRQYILTTIPLTEEHKEFTEKSFNYLKDSAKRLGRKDWLLLATGALINIIINTHMTSEQIRQVLRFAGIALGKIFGYVPSLIS